LTCAFGSALVGANISARARACEGTGRCLHWRHLGGQDTTCCNPYNLVVTVFNYAAARSLSLPSHARPCSGLPARVRAGPPTGQALWQATERSHARERLQLESALRGTLGIKRPTNLLALPSIGTSIAATTLLSSPKTVAAAPQLQWDAPLPQQQLQQLQQLQQQQPGRATTPVGGSPAAGGSVSRSGGTLAATQPQKGAGAGGRGRGTASLAAPRASGTHRLAAPGAATGHWALSSTAAAPATEDLADSFFGGTVSRGASGITMAQEAGAPPWPPLVGAAAGEPGTSRGDNSDGRPGGLSQHAGPVHLGRPVTRQAPAGRSGSGGPAQPLSGVDGGSSSGSSRDNGVTRLPSDGGGEQASTLTAASEHAQQHCNVDVRQVEGQQLPPDFMPWRGAVSVFNTLEPEPLLQALCLEGSHAAGEGEAGDEGEAGPAEGLQQGLGGEERQGQQHEQEEDWQERWQQDR
jgi:hypothetical protein